MPSLCPLTPCTTGVRPHLWASQSLSLAETVTGSGSLEGVSSGRMYLGNATTTTPVSLVLIQEKTLCRRRKGEEGPGECSGRPEARVLSATASESSGSTPCQCPPAPGLLGDPAENNAPFQGRPAICGLLSRQPRSKEIHSRVKARGEKIGRRNVSIWISMEMEKSQQ